jgi:hypothetical protein
MRVFRFLLSAESIKELEQASQHHTLPYVRERASAILKVHSGLQLKTVGESRLLVKRQSRTVRSWIDRYLNLGLSGLLVSEGRGRKPSFSPSKRNTNTGRTAKNRSAKPS